MNNTKNSIKILNIFKKGHLMSANDVVQKFPDMDRATVYRNINKLVKDGQIRELKLKKGMSSYEYIKDDHQHFICTDCGKILPVKIDDKVLKKLVSNIDFEIDEIQLVIKGKCNEKLKVKK